MLLPLCAGAKEPLLPTNARLGRLAENPFARLTTLLADLPPRGNVAPIVMSLGDPQHETPALAARIIGENAQLWNRYPPLQGTPEYRAACAAWLARRYRLPPEMISGERHVLALSGTKEGLFQAGLLAVRRSAERNATPRPRPQSLLPRLQRRRGDGRGRAPCISTPPPRTGFLPDLDALTAEELERCALFYLCTPGNPHGAIADLAYLKRAIRLARDWDFVLAVDECYCEIYDQAPPPGALEACLALGGDLRNVLVFHSLSKRSSAAGLRCGFVAGDPELIRRFQHLRSYGGAQIPLPLQLRGDGALAGRDACRAQPRALSPQARHRRGGARRALRLLPSARRLLPLARCRGRRARRARALARGGVAHATRRLYRLAPMAAATIPGSRYIRVALVHDDAVVADGMERLVRVLG